MLLSDGKWTTGRDPVSVAVQAGQAKVPIYTVALGTPNGTLTQKGRTTRVPPDPLGSQQHDRSALGSTRPRHPGFFSPFLRRRLAARQRPRVPLQRIGPTQRKPRAVGAPLRPPATLKRRPRHASGRAIEEKARREAARFGVFPKH